MAYTPNYTEEDISEATLSTLAKFVIGATAFVTIFIVVGLYAWVRKRL